MTMGGPLGSGESFYYKPLYPYVLALLHGLFGESLFGVVLVQRLLVALSVALVWRMTHVLFGPRTGLIGLVVAAVVLYTRLGPWAGILLGEIVFIPLSCGWALLAILLAARDDWRLASAAGMLGGLATLSRSTLFLAWPGVPGLLAAARTGRRRGPWPVVVMVAVMLSITGLATARNWIVARQFVPVTTSFAVNFMIGNQPPPGVRIPLHPVSDHALYPWIARDDRTRMALEFAVHAPAAFARNLLNKLLYTLGFFGAYVEGGGWAPLLVVTWISAGIGAAALMTGKPSAGLRGWVRAVPGVIALGHCAAVVLMFPHVYGDRLILPFYALILPYSALGLSYVARRGERFRNGGGAP
jgi:hypothetical protein